ESSLVWAQKALRLQNIRRSDHDQPVAAIIFCTADCRKVGRRTRSKWSRVRRYAMEYKSKAEPLATFIRRKGGNNACAGRFTRCLGRGGPIACVERFRFRLTAELFHGVGMLIATQ